MKKLYLKSKAWLSVIVILSMLSGFTVAFAADKPLVSSVKISSGVLTITGYSEKTYDSVDVFLLKPGKQVSDLNKAYTQELFDETVDYFSVCETDSFRKYTETITINDYDSNNSYLLYVKNGDNNSYTKMISPTVKIYVATNGNDTTGDGSVSKPYKTIEAAKKAVQSMEKNKDIEVIIKGGEYTLSSTLNFGTQDSGTQECPVTYRAAGNQKVIIKGTKTIDVSDAAKVADEEVLAKFQDGVKNKIVEIDLEKSGIPKEIVDFASAIEVGACGKTMGFYLNDEMQNIARWPDAGYKTISMVSGTTVAIDGMDAARAQNLSQNISDMHVEGYMGIDWHREWIKVQSVNAAQNTITLSNTGKYGIESGKRIAVINTPYELDTPGEWYADPDTMKLYYYPPHELTSNDKLEIATLDKSFVSLDNASYINFEGIEFAKNADNTKATYADIYGGNGIAIYKNSQGINISNCTFRDIGIDGIFISNAADVKINGCKFYNMGFSAVSSDSGVVSTLTSGNVTISNCIISKVNRNTGSNAYAAIRLAGVGTVVENNTLHNIANSAIRYKGNNHIIRNNEIYNSVNEAADAGAVYAGRSFSNYGTVIKNNYFHDLGSDFENFKFYTSGVFWDDLHSGNCFEGNIVDMNNTNHTVGVHIGGGRDNVVKNNIFVNTQIGIFGEDRYITVPDSQDINDSNNFYNQEEFQSFKEVADNVEDAYNITDNDWYEVIKLTFPKILENFRSLRNDHKHLRKNEVANNVFYNCAESHLKTESNFGVDSSLNNNLLLIYDSVFADAANNDYRIKQGEKEQNGIAADVPDNTVNMSVGAALDTEDLKEFDIVYPSNGTNIAGDKTKLVWESSPFADSYKYEIATDSEFKNIVASGETVYTTAYVENLTQADAFWWRVTAKSESRVLGETFNSKSVNKFTTSGSLTISNITYDKMTDSISFSANNTSSDSKDFYAIVAVKDTSERLLSVRSTKKTAKADTYEKMNVGTYFEGLPSGGTIEFYLWESKDNMVNITDKYSFAR